MRDRHDPPRPVQDPDDTVARLLQSAGRRQEVPAEAAAAVREAVRSEWQRAVQHEKERRRLAHRLPRLAVAAAAVLAISATVVGYWWREAAPRPPLPGPVATLESMRGEIWRVAAGEEEALDQGATLAAGTALETRSESSGGGRAILRLRDGTTLRLDIETRLRLVSERVFDLQTGALQVATHGAGGSVEISTVYGTVRDIGTRFEVRLAEAGTLQVRVQEGAIELQTSERRHSAKTGEALGLGADGQLHSEEIPPCNPPEHWTLAVLPSFDAAGRSAYDFLFWAAEIGNCDLRFIDRQLEAEARATFLGAGIDELSLREATEMISLGSGLDLGLRQEGSAWLVSRREAASRQ